MPLPGSRISQVSQTVIIGRAYISSDGSHQGSAVPNLTASFPHTLQAILKVYKYREPSTFKPFDQQLDKVHDVDTGTEDV